MNLSGRQNHGVVPTQRAMPELPEVETVRRGLENHLTRRRIERVELRRLDLRFPFPEGFAALLRGRLVESVERRAKYLLIRLEGKVTWMCHLGMTGRWTLLGANSSEADDGSHDWVVVHLDDGGRAVFSDHRRFGFMDHFETSEQDQNRFLSKLGPEPTPDHLTPMDMAEALRGRRTPMKAALLDQRTVAGLGNIYVCEILFRSGISPRRRASSVAGKTGVTKRVERVTAATHDVIVEAIDAGGSSISDFVNVEGDLGYFSHSFQVYGREGEPCLSEGCDTTIRRIVQAGRSTFYCPNCQR
uniref:Formamidopyrimidine-DNA glycosylase (MutM, fpg) n=1 Tax=uncultured marine group II/III euryarchaeote KM3_35_G08 TaxID=1456438 RepID=A0A075GZE6_9EURY|nr:formamidopyrimidine-DNA glycosylase (mutM, fpg) [uncultured marine group II/III euryarchaeote KM3_35_G08]